MYIRREHSLDCSVMRCSPRTPDMMHTAQHGKRTVDSYTLCSPTRQARCAFRPDVKPTGVRPLVIKRMNRTKFSPSSTAPESNDSNKSFSRHNELHCTYSRRNKDIPFRKCIAYHGWGKGSGHKMFLKTNNILATKRV